MKKIKLLFIALCLIIGTSCFLFSGNAEKQGEVCNMNIEALAQGISPRANYCVGVGSVECHEYKVLRKVEGYD